MVGLGCELRTALTLILSPLLTLLSDDEIPPSKKKNLNRIHRNTARLLKSVDSILVLSELESGNLPLKTGPIHLPSLLGQAMVETRPEAEKREVTFKSHIKETKAVQADYHQMIRIFSMLLEYILDEIQEESIIHISTHEKENQVEVLIAYTAKPISEMSDENPIEMAWARRSIHAKKTHGPDLALIRDLVLIMNGSIRMDLSQDGGQNHFLLGFPFSCDPPNYHPAQGGPGTLWKQEEINCLENSLPIHDEELPPTSVLLISEGGSLNNYIKELLAGEFKVAQTRPGDNLELFINDIQPEVILFDCLDLDGPPLLDQNLSELIPIITMLPSPGSSCSQISGSYDYIYKPFEPEIFRRRVRNAAELYRRRNESLAWKKERQQLKSLISESSGRDDVAEMATGILHNVGNVLNNVNVSAGLIEELIRKMKVSSIGRSGQLLEDSLSKLPPFEETDKLQKLVTYLAAIDNRLNQEQTAVLKEANVLKSNVQHIRVVIGLQQKLARKTSSIELVSLNEIMNDALEINAITLNNSNIEIILECTPSTPVMVDKHKVLQILVNLLSNAGHALEERGLEGKRIIFRGKPSENDSFTFSVYDNGIGIPMENLTKIFRHGFTTRETGFGFGLHASARAAEEMGGSLECESEGLHRGAIFTLRLPNKPPPS